MPLILAAIVFVLGFNVTPLSKYALVVVVAVYPLGANNKGYVALEVVTVYVTFVSVFGLAGIFTCKFVPATVPIVDVVPQDRVGALLVTATVFLETVIFPLVS